MTRKDVIWIILICILIAVCLLGIYTIDLSGPDMTTDPTVGSSSHGDVQGPDEGKDTTAPDHSAPTQPSVPLPADPTVPSTPTQPAEKTQVTVNTIWQDKNNQDGKRPASVTVHLMANGENIATQNITAEMGWAFIFTDLDVYSAGEQILYTVTVDALDEYATSVDGFTVTAAYEPEKTQVTVSAAWEDENDRDGKRPTSVTVHLLANGEVIGTQSITAEMGWMYTFADLDMFAAGEQITYTVTIDALEEYTTSVDGFTVTNTYEPEETQVTVNVLWDDENDQDGKRPESVTVHLLANGERIATQIITAETGWTVTFADLDMYANGEHIVYTVTTDSLEVYTTSVDGFTVTNTYEPEKTQVTVNTRWEDQNDQDGKRPSSVTIHLYANGERIATQIITAETGWTFTFADLDVCAKGEHIVYSIMVDSLDVYTSSVDGFTVTNTYDPEKTQITVNALWQDQNDQDGKRPASLTVVLLADGKKIASQILTAEMGWMYTFSSLDKFTDGRQIVYTVTADAPEGYTASVDGFTVINTHIPEKTQISVNAVWVDANNQDGKRPASIAVDLLANGMKVRTAILSAADGWKVTFGDLDQYENGRQIIYTISQAQVAGYSSAVSDYTVTYTHVPEKTQVTVNIVWQDQNNQDGKRPTFLTVHLLANGEKIASQNVTAATNWMYTFSDLDVFAAGEQITYTITIEEPEDYICSVDGFTATNTYDPEKTKVTVNTVWNDADDQDGKRPSSVTVSLLANGTKVQTATLTSSGGWQFTFAKLDKFIHGEQIVYTIAVDAPEGYTSSVDGFTVTNTHLPEKTQVTVNVAWNDADDQDGKRPASITVDLLANGMKLQTATLTLANGWNFTFADLDKYAKGEQINYTIMQSAVASYNSAVNGHTVTYTHTPEKTQVTVNATWQDANDQDGKRPSSVTVELYANGKKVQTATLKASGSWRYTFTDLDKYAKGEQITYTIAQTAVTGYSGAVSGYSVTYTHTPEKTQVTVNALWKDDNDQAGKRPTSVNVSLLANGKKVQTATMTSSGGWSVTFTKLDKYANGKQIAYTIAVDAIQDYTSAVDGFTVTNTYEPPVYDGPAYSIVLKPEASGVLVKSNDRAVIDYSNTVDGYVMVQFVGTTTTRLKVQVIGPSGTTYTYNIKVGQWEVLPLSDGEGTYRVRILENVTDNRYSTVLSLSTAVTLEDAFAPFIRPNQYVNYENATQTVSKSAELCRGKTDVLDKVKVVYDYVVNTLSYDYDLAATVESGYLPDLDAVLAEKKGICFDYAALMTAMLRCQGIPCKLVVGYAGTGYHAWISVWSEETGWIDGAVYFDGISWKRMDPTFASTSGGSQSVKDFIANDANYTTKYLY